MATKNRLNKLFAVAKNRQPGFVVVLEDIHDPHNAAAILRTCEGFGIQEVYYIFNSHDSIPARGGQAYARKPNYNPAKIGKVTSSSANKWLTFKIFRSTKECLRELRKKGYETVATILDKNAENLYEADLTSKKIALLVGNEHAGLSAEALAKADRKLYVPMRGFVQSFNVSVTAAIFLFEIARQRRARGGFKLSAKEAQKILREYKKKT